MSVTLQERLRLRTAAKLSRTQVAQACGVGRQTVANWEAGTAEPAPPARLAYLRLLEGLARLHPAPAEAPAAPAGPAPQPSAAAAPVFAEAHSAFGPDGLVVQGATAPCLRCGAPTSCKATDGRSLHSGGFCPAPAPTAASTAAATPPATVAAPAAASAAPASTPAPAPEPGTSPAALAA
ncbi:helix-turn-helix transcriptional regulator [Streptomyces sp. NPDC018019]|uniref:helix-turn-helix transcriptional regulator n=1 Tax=Streptomyces sp. NPDC018019 TaxID=3365030 RepID=UPI00379B915B